MGPADGSFLGRYGAKQALHAVRGVVFVMLEKHRGLTEPGSQALTTGDGLREVVVDLSRRRERGRAGLATP